METINYLTISKKETISYYITGEDNKIFQDFLKYDILLKKSLTKMLYTKTKMFKEAYNSKISKKVNSRKIEKIITKRYIYELSSQTAVYEFNYVRAMKNQDFIKMFNFQYLESSLPFGNHDFDFLPENFPLKFYVITDD